LKRDLEGRRSRVSIVAVVVLIIVALLLLAMLVAGVRKSAAVRHAQLGPTADYRSHAEAGRDGEEKT
jgi:hypothetical protein